MCLHERTNEKCGVGAANLVSIDTEERLNAMIFISQTVASIAILRHKSVECRVRPLAANLDASLFGLYLLVLLPRVPFVGVASEPIVALVGKQMPSNFEHAAPRRGCSLVAPRLYGSGGSRLTAVPHRLCGLPSQQESYSLERLA